MKRFLILTCCLSVVLSYAQDKLSYQKPPSEILELVDVSRAPGVFLDEKKENMILLYSNSYKSIEELSKEELRLGGLRIDPKTNIGSRVTYVNNIKIKRLKNKNSAAIQVKGLPKNAKLTNFGWSPDQSKLAMTHTTLTGVELWILDLKSAAVSKLHQLRLMLILVT